MLYQFETKSIQRHHKSLARGGSFLEESGQGKAIWDLWPQVHLREVSGTLASWRKLSRKMQAKVSYPVALCGAGRGKTVMRRNWTRF